MSEDIVVWVSAGAASAAALIKTIEQYPASSIRAVYNPVIEENEDNLRFLQDVENYTGIKIEVAKSILYPNASAVQVWDKVGYMAGPKGAPCTRELKKEARRTWEDRNQWEGWHVFGFTVEEKHRHQRRVDDGMKILPILIDAGMTKQDCFDVIKATGISLPAIYSISSRFGSGYPNANCIGCVKAASPTYWNHVRETFPEVFTARAEQSRRIGAKLARCHPKYLSWCEKRNGEWFDTRENKSLHVTDVKGVRKLVSPRVFLTSCLLMHEVKV